MRFACVYLVSFGPRKSPLDHLSKAKQHTNFIPLQVMGPDYRYLNVSIGARLVLPGIAARPSHLRATYIGVAHAVRGARELSGGWCATLTRRFRVSKRPKHALAGSANDLQTDWAGVLDVFFRGRPHRRGLAGISSPRPLNSTSTIVGRGLRRVIGDHFWRQVIPH